MASDFDPYRDLLKIQSPDRPPDHYVLLGLERFESDGRRIDEAAGERMSLLQEFANSEHLDASQKLLNEVSAARRCLLNATQKIAYDEDLRSRQRRGSANAGRKGAARKKGVSPLMPLGIAIAVVAVVCLVAFLLRGGPEPSGNLIVDWPESAPPEAVLLEGRRLSITENNPVYLEIPAGRHRIVFQRRGFQDIKKTHAFSDVKVRMKLVWVPEK